MFDLPIPVDFNQSLAAWITAICLIASILLVNSTKPSTHIHTPSAPLYVSFIILILSGAASGEVMQYFIGKIYEIMNK